MRPRLAQVGRSCCPRGLRARAISLASMRLRRRSPHVSLMAQSRRRCGGAVPAQMWRRSPGADVAAQMWRSPGAEWRRSPGADVAAQSRRRCGSADVAQSRRRCGGTLVRRRAPGRSGGAGDSTIGAKDRARRRASRRGDPEPIQRVRPLTACFRSTRARAGFHAWSDPSRTVRSAGQVQVAKEEVLPGDDRTDPLSRCTLRCQVARVARQLALRSTTRTKSSRGPWLKSRQRRSSSRRGARAVESSCAPRRVGCRAARHVWPIG
jgi:hypothetical protein